MRDKWQTTNVNRRGGNYGLGTIPKQLKANGIKSHIDDALWRVGLRVMSAKHHEFKECHGFRKYFKTYAQRTMKFDNVERLLGHAGHWSDAAYNRPPEDWLIEAYLKAVPDLTIYKPAATEEQLKWMDSKDQEVQQLKEQMVKMNDLVSALNSAVELYKPVFDAEMKRLNPHLDPSGFEISPFNDEMTNFLRRRGMKETSTTQD